MTPNTSTAGDLLIVEDSPHDLLLLQRALKRAEFTHRVRIARDGQEAVDALLGDDAEPVSPRLILLDLKLPKLNGHDVLRRLKANPRTRGIPVVMWTSSQEPRDIAESYDLGANSYIVKPVSAAHLDETVRAVGHYWLILNHTVQSGN